MYELLNIVSQYHRKFSWLCYRFYASGAGGEARGFVHGRGGYCDNLGIVNASNILV